MFWAFVVATTKGRSIICNRKHRMLEIVISIILKRSAALVVILIHEIDTSLVVLERDSRMCYDYHSVTDHVAL
jgi:hypothetical protein